MTGYAKCLGTVIFGSALVFACGNSKQESQPPAYPMVPPQAGAGNVAPPLASAPASAGTAPTTPEPAPVAMAQEVDPSLAATLQPLLQQMAKTQAVPGAKAMGNLIVANFSAPGQKLEKQIQLVGNKCYTVVAVGAAGVAEVNVKFVPLLPLATPVAVDNTTGPHAVLGPNPNCWKQIMFSAPMNLVVEVPQGQGLVGIQVYEK